MQEYMHTYMGDAVNWFPTPAKGSKQVQQRSRKMGWFWFESDRRQAFMLPKEIFKKYGQSEVEAKFEHHLNPHSIRN